MFHKIALGILWVFIGIMAAVTTVAYTRGYSGKTGLDMAKVQQMRYNTYAEHAAKE